MPNKSPIEWCDYTSNPIYAVSVETGKRGHHCVHKNALCENCYAESINLRWGTGLRFIAQNNDKVRFGLNVAELDALSKLDARLLRKGETARVFMFDMTDIALPGIPRHLVFEVLDRIATFQALTIQLLTKRPDEMLSVLKEYCAGRGDMSPEAFKKIFGHVHMGASVGTQKTADKDVPTLLHLAPYFVVLWLSIEPLLESLSLQRLPNGDSSYRIDALRGRLYGTITRDIHSIDARIGWGVIGGESGAGCRIARLEDLRDVCRQFAAAGVPYFVKQLGGKFTVDYYDHEFREDYEAGGYDWPEPLNWNTHNGQPPIGSRVRIPLKDRKGGDPSEWPEDLRVREFPSQTEAVAAVEGKAAKGLVT